MYKSGQILSNGLKGLDMRDLDVKGFEPAGGE